MANKRIYELQSEGTQSDSFYVEVDSDGWTATRKQDIGTLISYEKAERQTQDDVIEAAAGLATDGIYSADNTTNYLTNALFVSAGVTPSLKGADKLLDTQMKSIADRVSGFSNLTQYTVKISSAQVKALNATPISIIAAKGSLTVLNVVKCSFFLDYGTAAFNNGAALTLQYATSNKQILQSSAGLLAKTSDYYEQTEPDDNMECSVNDGIELTCASDGTTGGGSLYVNILYYVTDYNSYINYAGTPAS